MSGSSRIRVFLGLWLLLLSADAVAQTPLDFESHYDHGVSLYDQGSYPEAIAEFKAAYDVRSVPLVLINIVQAYLKMKQPRDALLFCDHYLQVDPNPRPDIRTRLDGYRARAQALLAEESSLSAASRSPEAESKAGSAPRRGQGEQAPSPSGPPSSSTAIVRHRARAPRPAWRVGTGLFALAGGGLLIGFGAAALSLNGQCIESTGCAYRYATVTPGVAMLVPGGGLLLVGVALLAVPGPWQGAK